MRNFGMFYRQQVDLSDLARRRNERMRNSLKSKLNDPDMQAVPRALLRAAQRAREIARQHGTGIIVMRDGRIVEEEPTDLDIEALLRD
jgi:broad specificity phosphatase PhoE